MSTATTWGIEEDQLVRYLVLLPARMRADGDAMKMPPLQGFEEADATARAINDDIDRANDVMDQARDALKACAEYFDAWSDGTRDLRELRLDAHRKSTAALRLFEEWAS